MWRDKQRKYSHFLRTIVWGQVGMALFMVSLALSTSVMAFTLNTTLLPGADTRHDTTSSTESEPPSPQFLRLSIAITQGRVTIGPVTSPAWKAAHRRNVRLPLADQAGTPEKQPAQTVDEREEQVLLDVRRGLSRQAPRADDSAEVALDQRHTRALHGTVWPSPCSSSARATMRAASIPRLSMSTRLPNAKGPTSTPAAIKLTLIG